MVAEGEKSELLPHRSIQHVKQQKSWDCGLACVLMVLRSFDVNTVRLQDLYVACETKSVWTIDLAHILARTGFSVIFCTVTLGANPEFASDRFYRGQIQTDRTRVERLFFQAEQAGISIRKRSLHWTEIRDALKEGTQLVIVLVDRWLLRTSDEVAASNDGLCCCGLWSPGYLGHYVLITDYLPECELFVVHDPALSQGMRYIDVLSLDRARRCFGTDEDLLIVSRRRCQSGLGCIGGKDSALCSQQKPTQFQQQVLSSLSV